MFILGRKLLNYAIYYCRNKINNKYVVMLEL